MARFGDSAVLGRRWQELEVQCGGGGVATLIFSILGPRKTRRFSVQEGLVGVLVAYPELLLLGYCL